MEASVAMDKEALAAIRNWFEEYMALLTIHKYGKNNMPQITNALAGRCRWHALPGLQVTKRSLTFAATPFLFWLEGDKVKCNR